MTKRDWERLLKRLSNLSRRAYTADDKFRDALEKAKERQDWEEFCTAYGINPESNDGDWKS